MIELMVTLSVVAILATIAVPAFTEVIQNNRRSAQINDLIRSLMVARSKAVATAIPVTVCKTASGTSCDGANWEDGWMVFVDNNTVGVVDTGDTDIIEHHGPLNGGNTLRGNSNVVNRITYRADGTSNIQGTFTLCDARGAAAARAVIVSQTGRPRSDDKASDGNALSCP